MSLRLRDIQAAVFFDRAGSRMSHFIRLANPADVEKAQRLYAVRSAEIATLRAIGFSEVMAEPVLT